MSFRHAKGRRVRSDMGGDMATREQVIVRMPKMRNALLPGGDDDDEGNGDDGAADDDDDDDASPPSSAACLAHRQ